MTRRLRRRVEAGAALLAFPAAVALTVATISSSPAGSTAEPATAAPVPSAAHVQVELTGADPVPTYAVADKLSAAGYDVVAVTPGPAHNSLSATTVVVYYERERRAAALRLRDVLGAGTIRREQVLEPRSDLTVLLGKDPQRT